MHVCRVCVRMQTDLEPSQPSGPAQHLASYLSLRTSVMNKHRQNKNYPKMKITEWNLEEAGVNPQHGKGGGGMLRK